MGERREHECEMMNFATKKKTGETRKRQEEEEEEKD